MADGDFEPCPYKSLPDRAFWRRSVPNPPEGLLDPIVSTKFSISADDRIATAGSCFAQHIARFLSESGYNYYVTEPGHPQMGDDLLRSYNYGTFSARYANLYTTRQLYQTFLRAYGMFEPRERFWTEAGRFIDPYRPFIQPGGFSSRAEFEEDQARHFAAIRKMVENLDVFVFTLGLTEAWQSLEDGAVFPIAPGCGAGQHDSSRHGFINFTHDQVNADLDAAIRFILERNATAKILLTVSPVPLIATYEPQHVLVSTTYSKSLLRVAAETVKQRHSCVDYFPSYEIITGNFSKSAYYEDDLREVRMEGVHHAMTCFFRHYLGVEIGQMKHQDNPARETVGSGVVSPVKRHNSVNEKIGSVICDEEQLDA